jgi:hypothetical protein
MKRTESTGTTGPTESANLSAKFDTLRRKINTTWEVAS